MNLKKKEQNEQNSTGVLEENLMEFSFITTVTFAAQLGQNTIFSIITDLTALTPSGENVNWTDLNKDYCVTCSCFTAESLSHC